MRCRGSEPERGPDHRVFEERVVEEAVDADRDEDEPEDHRGLAGEVGGGPAEGEQEPGDEEPDQQRESGYPRFGRDGDRRVVRGGRLRLLAAQVLLLRVAVLEAADTDPDHGMVDGELESVRD